MKLISKNDRGRSCCISFAVCLAFLFCLPTSGAVADGQKPTPITPVHHYFSKAEHQPDAKWGYTGKLGPRFWGTLNPKYHLAKDGKQQSPIDIQMDDVLAKPLPPLKFDYHKERIAAINNGHSIQHNMEPSSFLHAGDHVYALEQFHVHVPSEHKIDGYHADMEIHFVHKSSSGELMVLAVMVYVDSKNPVYVPLYQQFPKQVDERVVAPNDYKNPIDLLPKEHSYLEYMGSFTTPPCTENIRWFVMKTPISIAPEVFDEFRQTIGGNNRPVQKLFGRQVVLKSGSGQVD